MQRKLLPIFNAITPDNIKNIAVIKDSMKMFIELLEEYSNISIDIKNVLSENTSKIISDELIKIYLFDYYSMIYNLKNNRQINEKISGWNNLLNPTVYPEGLPIIGKELFINYFIIGQEGETLDENAGEDLQIPSDIYSGRLADLESQLLSYTPESFYINRKFKENKGLIKSINYIYNIINNYMVLDDEQLDLEIKLTNEPFELYISGSIDKDIYKHSVAYLSHPLGFAYNYKYISLLQLSDSYYTKKIYKNSVVEVRCLSGNFESYSKEVIDIIDETDYLRVTFFDGSYLEQENYNINYYDINAILIKNYPESVHCSIYTEYEIVYENTTTDIISFQIRASMIEDVDIRTNIIDSDIGFISSSEFPFGFIVGKSIVNTIENGGLTITADTDVVDYYNDNLEIAKGPKLSSGEIFGTPTDDFSII